MSSSLRKYQFVDGARTPKGVKAQEIGSAIDSLKAERGGKITAEDVLNAARDEGSPLHSCFEWNERKAAHEYRLVQARTLLRSIEIVEGDDRPAVRAYIVIREGGEDTYQGTADVMKDAGKREQVLLRAYTELLSWRDRYADLREFSSVFGEVDAFPVPPKVKRVA